MNLKSQAFNSILSPSYYATKLVTHLWYSVITRNKPTLLVYQMGKVGSTTIEKSLRNSGINYSIFHIHYLTKNGLLKEEKAYYGDTPKYRRTSYWPKTKHLFASHFLSRRVCSLENQNWKWKIVTLVRDPIARNISSFFQALERVSPDQLQLESSTSENVMNLQGLFLNGGLEAQEPYEYPFDWFNHELKPSFSIDVFETEFSRDQGYQIYQGEIAEVLLLKLEKIDEHAESAFNQFLGVKKINLRTSNESEKKAYSSTYSKFIASLNLPKAYIEDQYIKNRVSHFYSDEEIAGFVSKWENPGSILFDRET